MTIMKITENLTDTAVLAALGERITAARIALNLTQAQLAEQAGIGKRTLERMEAGASAQTLTLVRVLRALQLLPRLEQLLPAAGPRPLDQLKRGGKTRQRASSARSSPSAAEPWQWDESA
jgi:transcriptional regulator with XRE-family HTH domain